MYTQQVLDPEFSVIYKNTHLPAISLDRKLSMGRGISARDQQIKLLAFKCEKLTKTPGI